MNRFRFASVAILLVVPARPVHAKLLPSFDQTYSAWHATHIVVVDAKGTVLESWSGDLKVGKVLPLDKLGVPAPAAISYKFQAKGPNDPERVSGSRMVLFLKREGDAWKPAVTYGGMQAAVAWVEAGQAYAYQQLMNPGPCEIVPLALTEAQLNQQVADIVGLHTALREAGRHPDPTKRAQVAVRFVDRELSYCRQEAFQILVGEGKLALPVLRNLLQDEDRLRLHPDVMAAMRAAGGMRPAPI